MKKTLTLILMTCFLSVVGQEKILEDVVSFELKNSGTIEDNNKDVNGYFFFYKVDDLKKGKVEYAIKILDQNLNDVATKSYIDDKNTSIVDCRYNGNSVIFLMVNLKEKFYKLLAYNKSGEEIKKITIPIAKKDVKWVIPQLKQGLVNNLISVGDKGFIFNHMVKNKKLGYKIKYIATDGGKNWDFNSKVDSKSILGINPLQANNKVIALVENSRPSIFSKQNDTRVLFLDSKTGKLLFEKDYDAASNPKMVTNIYLKGDNELVIIGEYFKEGENISSSKSQGIFAESNDLTGKVLFESKIGWEGKLNEAIAKANEGEELSKRNYIFFHDFIKTESNEYYAIGEFYKKTANAGGIALNALAALGGGAGGARMAQLTITDAVVLKLDSKFNLVDTKIFKKGKSRIPSFAILSPQVNALITKAYGGFDYIYSQNDIKKDRFYANFVDYERIQGEKNGNALKTIVYSDGKLSEDKIKLKSKRREFSRVMPAKVGYVLINDYSRKEKTITLHLEKINVN